MRFISVAIVLALGGCIDEVTHLEPSETHATKVSEVPNGPPVPDFESPERPMSFQMNACEGFWTRSYWPGTTGPGAAPPNWSIAANTPFVASVVELHLFDCERVSWGTFERPATMLFEVHNKFDPPSSCDSDTQLLSMLNSVWISDPGLSRFLATTYGLPALHGVFSHTSETGSPPYADIWTWAGAGTAASDVTVHYLGDALNEVVFQERHFWSNGKGISFMNLNVTSQAHQETAIVTSPNRLVTGTMNEPMLNAQAGTDYRSVNGHLLTNEDGSGELKEFGDFECGKPLL